MIRRASISDLAALAVLFDAYRQFYEQASDVALAQDYLRARLTADESIVFVSADAKGALQGFVQLYPTFCSVAAAPILVLYDLFVAATARRGGVGKQLMLAAQAYGREQGAARLELSTALDNLAGQALYEALGWQLDEDFFHYSRACSS